MIGVFCCFCYFWNWWAMLSIRKPIVSGWTQPYMRWDKFNLDIMCTSLINHSSYLSQLLQFNFISLRLPTTVTLNSQRAHLASSQWRSTPNRRSGATQSGSKTRSDFFRCALFVPIWCSLESPSNIKTRVVNRAGYGCCAPSLFHPWFAMKSLGPCATKKIFNQPNMDLGDIVGIRLIEYLSIHRWNYQRNSHKSGWGWLAHFIFTI